MTYHAIRARVSAVGPAAPARPRWRTAEGGYRLGGRRLGCGSTASSILGSEGGSYYAGECTLTRENAEAVERCIAADGCAPWRDRRGREAGRAPKNDPAVFALAMAAALGDEATRKAALDGAAAGLPHRHAPVPVRAFVEGFRGWGRALRRAVAAGTPAARPTRWPTRRSSTGSATA